MIDILSNYTPIGKFMPITPEPEGEKIGKYSFPSSFFSEKSVGIKYLLGISFMIVGIPYKLL